MGTPGSILVVDDDRTMRVMLVDHLQHSGIEACAAASVDDALHELRSRDFTAVLSDIHMPGKGGFELLDEVRQLGHPPRVILMTSFGGPTTAEEARRAGAFDYLPKPFDLEALTGVVNRALHERP